MGRIIKTIEVKPHSEHHNIVDAIMQKFHLKETQRVVVAGNMSEVAVVLTFEGTDEYYRLFKDRYIEIPIKQSCNKTSNFYSIEALDGFMGTTEQFKDFILKKRSGRSDFEFKELDWTINKTA